MITKHYFILILFILSCSKINNYENQEELIEEEILQLEQVLVIDGLEDPSLYFQPWDMVTDSNNNIYILSPPSFKIFVFDKNGTYLSSIGKKGEAPEEFSYLYGSGFCIDKNMNIYVVNNLYKIKMFNINGNFIKEINLKGKQIFDIIAKDTLNIYANISFSQDIENLIIKINNHGFIKEIFSNTTEDIEINTLPWKEIFQRSCKMVVDDSGYIFSCRIVDYEINKYDSTGKTIYTIKGDTPYHVMFEGYNNRTIIPVIWDICVDSNNRLYVLWGQGGEENGNRVDVYNTNNSEFLGYFHTGVKSEDRNMFIYIDNQGFFYTATLDSCRLYKFKMNFREGI